MKIQKALEAVLKDFALPARIDLSVEDPTSIYLNDEETRTFLAVNLADDPIITKYISIIDSVLKEFALPSYYSPAKLHFSFASSAGNLTKILNLNDDYKVHSAGDSIPFDHVPINQILIKCGNKIKRISG